MAEMMVDKSVVRTEIQWVAKWVAPMVVRMAAMRVVEWVERKDL